jgi:hypothetical protein
MVFRGGENDDGSSPEKLFLRRRERQLRVLTLQGG